MTPPPASDVVSPSPASAAADATRGSAIKLGTELLARLVGLLTTLLLARQLGAADFGLFGRLSVIAVVLAEAADLGLQGTASRALVAGTISIRAMTRAKLVLTALVAGLAGAGLPVAPVLCPLVLFFVAAGWSEFLGVALRARGDRGLESAVIFCLRLVGLLLVGAALLQGAGLVGVAWAHAASPLPAILLGLVLLRRKASPAVPADPPLAAILRESAPLAVNGGLALLSLRVEFLVLSFVRGGRETGLFLAALRVVEFLNLVPSAVVAGAMPALTREAIRGEGPVRARSAATLAFLAVPAACGLALVAPGLLGFLFGSASVAAAPSLRWLAAALVPLFLNGLVVGALIAAGHARRLPPLTVVRVAAATALAFVLVPSLGAAGAAVGFLASELLLLVLGLRACRVAAFPIGIAGPVGRAIVATLPMVVAVSLAQSLPVAIGAGLVAYGGTLALLGRLRPAFVRDLVDVRYPS
ncbi:MAG TPA: polysaccharide biosynthesis C-terminal domain-containing protein [Vicinamibacteria bacterium]